MRVLIVGASGATGKNLVEQLLIIGHHVKIILRPSSRFPKEWKDNDRVTIIYGNVNEISVDEMADYIKDCHAAASCLGHNLSLKGMYGKPRKLVTEAVKLLCNAIIKNSHDQTIKIVLMNTAGNQNRDLNETISFGEKMILGLIRLLLPPHTDNESAADFLRVKISQKHPLIRWVVVRPDSLINSHEVTPYSVHKSPTSSAIFNPGKTSRINVGHFMARLIDSEEEWGKWEGKMPVQYNVPTNETSK